MLDETGGAVASNGEPGCAVAAVSRLDAPLDRTGAEDAFAATLVAALVRGSPFAEALLWPPVNFMSVSHELGSQAGLLHEEQLLEHLGEAGGAFSVRRC